MKKIFLALPIWGLLFLGCMDLEQKISINENGSGTITLNYAFDKEFMEMSMFEDEDEENNQKDDIVFAREDIEKEIEGIKGLKLIDFKTNMQGGNLYVMMKLSFENIKNLQKKWMFENMRFKFKRVGNKFVWNQTVIVNEEGAESMDDSELGIYKAMMDNHYITFIVEMPSAIASASKNGVVNGNTVTWKISLIDYIKARKLKLNTETK